MTLTVGNNEYTPDMHVVLAALGLDIGPEEGSQSACGRFGCASGDSTSRRTSSSIADTNDVGSGARLVAERPSATASSSVAATTTAASSLTGAPAVSKVSKQKSVNTNSRLPRRKRSKLPTFRSAPPLRPVPRTVVLPKSTAPKSTIHDLKEEPVTPQSIVSGERTNLFLPPIPRKPISKPLKKR